MGQTVIEDVLDDNATLNTQKLEDLDHDGLANFFEPTLNVFGNVSVKSELPQAEVSQDEERDSHDYASEHVQDNPDKEAIEISSVSFEDFQDSEIKQSQPINVDNSNKAPVVEVEIEGLEDSDEIEVPIDPNYEEPKYDVTIGNNNDSLQFGILGKVISNNRKVAIDLNECNTISLFGVQGAGKSYTIGSITEMVVKQFSKVNLLPAPMASVIFHYSDSMDYAPEFTSMVYPNDDVGQLAKLKAEYGAEASSVNDVVLLAPASQVDIRKSEYPSIDVYPIGFDSSAMLVTLLGIVMEVRLRQS